LSNIGVSLLDSFPSLLLFFLSGQFILFASHHAKVSALLSGPNRIFFELFIDAHEYKSIMDQTFLDVPVKRGIC
jgi:hypothetical protein